MEWGDRVCSIRTEADLSCSNVAIKRLPFERNKVSGMGRQGTGGAFGQPLTRRAHLLQLIVQDVGAHVGHDLSAGGVLGALGGVQLVQVTEADVVAFADGVEVLHVTVRKQRLKLVAR